jgi:ubiquitin-conjugating enzyme E2 W
MQGQVPPGIELIKVDDFKEWLVDLRVLDQNPLYEGEVYRLKFTFGKNYPIGTFTLHSEHEYKGFAS